MHKLHNSRFNASKNIFLLNPKFVKHKINLNALLNPLLLPKTHLGCGNFSLWFDACRCRQNLPTLTRILKGQTFRCLLWPTAPLLLPLLRMDFWLWPTLRPLPLALSSMLLLSLSLSLTSIRVDAILMVFKLKLSLCLVNFNLINALLLINLDHI